MTMYADIRLLPVYENQQYVSPDGTQYPGNFPKNEIAALHAVTETPQPTDPSLIVLGFTINAAYTQVWTTRPKTVKELTNERKIEASEALTKSDITVLRCVENNIPVPEAWAVYRQTLRAIKEAGDQSIPAKPAYPEGT